MKKLMLPHMSEYYLPRLIRTQVPVLAAAQA